MENKRQLLQPHQSRDPHFTKSSFDIHSEDNRRILVAYAGKYGSTGEVAETIGDVLLEEGNTVETKNIDDLQYLDRYDAVIVGSAIQYDRWLPAATKFVTTNQDALSKIPVAYFYTCLVLATAHDMAGQQAMKLANRISTLTPRARPVDVTGFAGVLDFSDMSPHIRLLLKAISLITGVREGDYRDWGAIRGWAKSMHLKLSTEKA